MPPAVTESHVPVAAPAARTTIARRAVAAKWPITVATVLVILAVWTGASLIPGAPIWLVGPGAIVVRMVEEAGRLVELSAVSLVRLGAGFLIGAVLGVALGLINGVLRWLRGLSDPIVNLTYPLPKVALFPAIAVILGYTDASRIFIIALAAFYPAYLGALVGSRSVDPRFLDMARNAGVGRLRIFSSVIFPASLPRVFVGLRISLAVSFVLLYVAEALGGAGQGLGFRIVLVAQTNDYAQLYALVACFALLGVLADRALLYGGRWITRGQELEVVGDAK